MDRLTTLRALVLTADHRSFSEAARRLQVSPTAISRAIGSLERELGVLLLRRTTRSINPTPEGLAYLDRARRILEDLDEADRSARGEDAEPSGPLIVTAPIVFARLYVLPVVAELMTRYPSLRVQLTLNNRLVRLVEEGIDVAVRIADLSDSSLHAVRIAEVAFTVVASPDYLHRYGVPKSIADLHQHRLIATGTLAGSAEWRFGGTQPGAIRFHPVLATEDIPATLEAALSGIGIARLLSYQVQDDIAAGRLISLLKEAEPPRLPVHLVFQPNRRRAPNVAAFIAAMQSFCASRDFY